MIKIKLEQWKEVIRLEVVNGVFPEELIFDTIYFGYIDSPNIRISKQELRTLYFINSDSYILSSIKKIIEKYNNSLKKNNGYEWFCDGCECECIAKEKNVYCGRKYKTCFTTGAMSDERTKSNWQPINNNKIEIITDNITEQEDEAYDWYCDNCKPNTCRTTPNSLRPYGCIYPLKEEPKCNWKRIEVIE